MSISVSSVVEDPALVEKRRKQIVEAATELFAKQGFYKTTIKDIAKKAGISYGGVYLYVREKEDVLLLVLQQVVNAYAEEIPKAMAGVANPLERLVRAIEAYCRVVDKHRAATVLAYRSTKSLSPDRRQVIQQLEIETNNIIAEAIRDCINAGLMRDLNVDVLTYQVVLMAHGWALKSWYFKSCIELEDYIAESLETVLTGSLTSSGRTRYSRHASAVRPST
ncbi:TetR/AcrR family transcriptional regulator [Bradyrhizobium sp. INPA01-394B]|jgi:AcrR family transcriptional regulator|uniref:TetR/AcrR family transcriptional regulator n=1 Tax=Bradyrhizobium campsiandrae TaxID=1729892 RepID=A0ABR7UF40_9BRAD|nr:TetR/AcrR family transcriptional regulator [Bradyrhizobium campsiandrae]MBC9883013.1 TetR/AcrR family transcriptional regulator [Bradyrhizobium campsiandrae]MBC9982245.1 TetR/AcrR family transcriptional regulator [Bradyrhizobium campsiandrae]